MVWHNGVEHSHAAFVKNADNGLLFFETSSLCVSDLCCAASCALKGMDVRAIVRDGSGAHPLLESVQEKLVGKVDAPEGRVGDACLGKRPIEVEQTDETGPLSTPVGDSEDRTFMCGQAWKHMMAILPDGLRHNERSVFGDSLKDVHSITLRIEKSVLLVWHVGVSTNNLSAETLYGLSQGLFHCRLRGPT